MINMHELGVVFEIIKIVENVAIEQNIDEIDTIIMEIGELSSIVPMYLEDCFPAAIYDKPMFENTKLKIEIIKGEAKCNQCGNVFNVVKNEGYCPECNCFEKELISGREFTIKEIIVEDID